jgi:hypothetical protein
MPLQRQICIAPLKPTKPHLLPPRLPPHLFLASGRAALLPVSGGSRRRIRLPRTPCTLIRRVLAPPGRSSPSFPSLAAGTLAPPRPSPLPRPGLAAAPTARTLKAAPPPIPTAWPTSLPRSVASKVAGNGARRTPAAPNPNPKPQTLTLPAASPHAALLATARRRANSSPPRISRRPDGGGRSIQQLGPAP